MTGVGKVTVVREVIAVRVMTGARGVTVVVREVTVVRVVTMVIRVVTAGSGGQRSQQNAQGNYSGPGRLDRRSRGEMW